MELLKPFLVQVRQFFINKFTFQYGTIKTFNPFLNNAPALAFTFQYGTIKTIQFGISILVFFTFTFQYGTIKTWNH